jgi:hypothetical protein
VAGVVVSTAADSSGGSRGGRLTAVVVDVVVDGDVDGTASIEVSGGAGGGADDGVPCAGLLDESLQPATSASVSTVAAAMFQRPTDTRGPDRSNIAIRSSSRAVPAIVGAGSP